MKAMGAVGAGLLLVGFLLIVSPYSTTWSTAVWATVPSTAGLVGASTVVLGCMVLAAELRRGKRGRRIIGMVGGVVLVAGVFAGWGLARSRYWIPGSGVYGSFGATPGCRLLELFVEDGELRIVCSTSELGPLRLTRQWDGSWVAGPSMVGGSMDYKVTSARPWTDALVVQNVTTGRAAVHVPIKDGDKIREAVRDAAALDWLEQKWACEVRLAPFTTALLDPAGRSMSIRSRGVVVESTRIEEVTVEKGTAGGAAVSSLHIRTASPVGGMGTTLVLQRNLPAGGPVGYRVIGSGVTLATVGPPRADVGDCGVVMFGGSGE